MAGILEEIIGLDQRRSHGEYALDGGAAPDTVAELEAAMAEAERVDMLLVEDSGETHLTEVLRIGKSEKKVIDAFLDKKAGSSNYLKTDGKELDGLWMGGRGIAKWSGGKITLPDLGSKSAEVAQRAIKKMAPKNWLAEDEQPMATGWVLVDQLTEAYVGTVYKDGKDMYVDTAFVNSVSSGAPDFYVDHMGFGEFVIKGPGDVRIEVDRMRGKEFPGQSGRSHKLYPGRGTDKKIVSKLVAQMVKRGKAKIAKKFKVPSPKAVAQRTGMKLRAKPRGKIQKAVYDYLMTLFHDGDGRRPWIELGQLAVIPAIKGTNYGKIMKSLDSMVQSKLLDKTGGSIGKGEQYRLAENRATENEDVEALTEALQADIRTEFPVRKVQTEETEQEGFATGIDEDSADILASLAGADNFTLSAPSIAEATGIEKPVVRRALEDMGNSNLVARTHPASDNWRLTHFGEAAIAERKGNPYEKRSGHETEAGNNKDERHWSAVAKKKKGAGPSSDKRDEKPWQQASKGAKKHGKKAHAKSVRRSKRKEIEKRLKGEGIEPVSERSTPQEIPYAKYCERHRKADADQGFTPAEERKLKMMGVKDLVNMEMRLLKAYNKDRSKGNKLRLISVQNLLARMNTRGQGRSGGGSKGHYNIFDHAERGELELAEGRVTDIIAAFDVAQQRGFDKAEVVAGKGSEDYNLASTLKSVRDGFRYIQKDLKAGRKGGWWKTQEKNDWPFLKQLQHAFNKATPAAKKDAAPAMKHVKTIYAIVRGARNIKEDCDCGHGLDEVANPRTHPPLKSGEETAFEKTGKVKIVKEADGSFLAMTRAHSKNFKTYEKALAWLDKNASSVMSKWMSEEAEEKGSYKAKGPLEKMIGEMVRGQSGKWLSEKQMKAIVGVLNKKGITKPSKDSYDDIARIVGKTLSALK